MTCVIFKSSLYFVFGENPLSYYMNNLYVYDAIEPNYQSHNCNFCNKSYWSMKFLCSSKVKYDICCNCVKNIGYGAHYKIVHCKHRLVAIRIGKIWYGAKSIFKYRQNEKTYFKNNLYLNCIVEAKSYDFMCQKYNINKRNVYTYDENKYVYLYFYWSKIKITFMIVKSFVIVGDLQNYILEKILFSDIIY